MVIVNDQRCTALQQIMNVVSKICPVQILFVHFYIII